jgi:excisionase family DNA binding protein
MEPLTVTVEEAAGMLGISRNTAYSLIAQDKIKHIRLGKRIVISRIQLEALLSGK